MPVETVVFNWVQPTSTDEECELVLAFNEVAAVMRWTEAGVEVETAYNNWRLKQVGVIRTTIEARNTGKNSVEAIYKVGFRKGGTFRVNSERNQFAWKVLSPKGFELVDDRGESWAKIFLEVNPKSKTGLLETTQGRVDEPEFEVLMALSWYLGVTELGFKGSYLDRLADGTPGNGGYYTR
jgi:hypothetical protein